MSFKRMNECHGSKKLQKNRTGGENHVCSGCLWYHLTTATRRPTLETHCHLQQTALLHRNTVFDPSHSAKTFEDLIPRDLKEPRTLPISINALIFRCNRRHLTEESGNSVPASRRYIITIFLIETFLFEWSQGLI